jgi:hypothetical protein
MNERIKHKEMTGQMKHQNLKIQIAVMKIKKTNK